MIDWPNIVATLAAALIGGLIASKVARYQIQATQQVEREKILKETARELIEAIDSLVHIAYRDQNESSYYERQRLRRRILSLTALTIPERFESVKDHLLGIDRWWRQKQPGYSGTYQSGLGFSATSAFFEALKSELFRKVFGQQLDFAQEQG